MLRIPSSLMLAIVCGLFAQQVALAKDSRPNILWIIVEDASAHIGCYGETTIRTPTLDALASEGIRFTRAFVTCPVCSPSRSAMVTGMFQTTFGAHNHRSQSASGKGKGGPGFIDSYRLPIRSIPRLFKQAGYHTCNSTNGLPSGAFGKTDYNFVWELDDYDGSDWATRNPKQPFFAQVQLRGGKNRTAQRHGADPSKVRLPAYYPTHPVMQTDWASYLNSWVQCDMEVKAILERLDREGIADDTAVFFWTDHGVSHVRGKQFLYEEGIHVPLIVRLPGSRSGNTTRHDLVSHIDVAATSLALAGIDIPSNVQGVDLLADDYRPREVVFSARDRCDETVEIMRCVRGEQFKYIRNFLPHLPHAQPNQYKDSKQIIKTLRQLHADGQLDELQSRVFAAPRPHAELYDLKRDPLETKNLASDPAYQTTAQSLRRELYDWMTTSGDLGLIPEPVLEELGRRYGSKYAVLQQADKKTLIADIIGIIEAGENRQFDRLLRAAESPEAALRYWAATQLGVYGRSSHTEVIEPLTRDSSGGVRVAAALALCRLGQPEGHVSILVDELNNDNYLVGMYAIRALELTGDAAKPHLSEIRAAQNSDFEFTRRIAKRITHHFQ